jgi:hypothetical protein
MSWLAGASKISSRPASSLAIALAWSTIYWSNDNGISRADLEGQNVDQFITMAGPWGLAVDSGHIYWAFGASR